MASRGASAVVLQCERLKNASFVSDKRDIIEDLKVSESAVAGILFDV